MAKEFIIPLVVCLLVFILPSTVEAQDAADWLIDDTYFKARVEEEKDQIVLSNGLIQRTIRIFPNAATVSFDQLTINTSLLRGVKPEGEISINGRHYAIGGLIGQPNYAFLKPSWIDLLIADTSAWMFTAYEISDPQVPFDWKRVRHHQQSQSWPPAGIHVQMHYKAPSGCELDKVRITIHYECYDGLPVIAKWMTVVNDGQEPIEIDNFTSELLAIVENGSSVEAREYNVSVPNLHVETDYAFSSFTAVDANHHVVHWEADPQYHSQVNYLKTTPCLLRVSPEMGPAQHLEEGDTMHTYRTFVLAHDSYDRERQGLGIRRMYRKIAPWTTENPLMMHARYADWDRVKEAIDQAADAGFEMVILTFGSGFDIENTDSTYLDRMQKYADYARNKGVEIGGYSLLASRSISAEDDVIMPEGKQPTFGKSPCLGSNWAQKYFQKLYEFYENSGFTLLEHDGSYPGDFCMSASHPGHKGFSDSRWNQYQIISSFYKWCREKGIYLNIPDYYYLTGGSKCGMGYRETNWSLPRAQQVIHTRQNIYDGTWTKLVTMGWMFVPLTEYHGGGEAATIEPLDQHLDHYSLMMMSNLGAGVQACYRGPRLYDTERTKAMVQNRISWYKNHRTVLEGDLIHLRRADGRDLDYWLMVNPGADEKGALVVFNPGDDYRTKSIKVPLYYTGLSDEVRVYTDDEILETLPLDRGYHVELEVSVAPGKWSVYFFK
ncbi:MAG: alpha-galactosidase [Saprospiraceae bacterium]|nr:alpha-galactosidase [Saprospiraceae bacterium]